MRKRILFVDDDQNILDGLRRMLRPQGREWDMHFAISGNAALEAMESEPFDVVVSDMRMPGMNGVEFLKKVRETYPGAVRIGLSGHTDSAMILEAAGATHQYLAKPCEPHVLQQIVDRSCALQERLDDHTLRELLSRMDSVPVPPQTYKDIMAELQTGEPSMQRIGEIIAADVGMSAKILQLVNSAYFGLARHVSSPTEAVMLLGLNTIRALVLQNKVFSSFENLESAGLSPERLSRTAVRAASLARKLAAVEKMPDTSRDYAFMAGMLHNLGTLVIGANYPERYKDAMQRSDREGKSQTDAELEEFGTTHMDVGGFLLDLWGLPYSIVEGVAFYNRPAVCDGGECSPLTMVHVATAYLRGEDDAAGSQHIDMDYIGTLGLEDRVPAWTSAFNEWLATEETDQ